MTTLYLYWKIKKKFMTISHWFLFSLSLLSISVIEEVPRVQNLSLFESKFKIEVVDSEYTKDPFREF